MAPKTKSEKPVEEMNKKNLKVDPSKHGDAHLPPNRSPSDATSCISSTGDATCSFKDTDVDQESMYSEQSFYYPANSYYGYYYPGYDSSAGELDEQGYYYSSDGLEIQYPAVQGDNGSLVYYTPGYQPGYVPYNPYLPGTAMGIDGQYLNQQSYYVSPVSPQPMAATGYYPTSLTYGSEVMPSYMWDPSFQSGEVVNGSSYGGVPYVPGYNSSFSVPAHTYAPSKSVPSSKPSNTETKGSLPALEDVSNANEVKPVNKANSTLAKGYFPMAKFPGSNQGKGGLLYPNSSINFKPNGRGWGATDKLKARGKPNGVGEFDLLNEQNRGPRTNSTKGAFAYGVDTAGSLLTKGNDGNDSSAALTKADQYNDPNFLSKYDHALFFVIKSYSEDDIHKSIKYNVWASTPNGNKRLDSAYQEAQEKMGEKGSKCPVFLFFSVNASGQFCGVAEMIGRVDFNKNMDFWQQDKWNGFFPVKWHFIKDVPNPHFRHIILENNDNKPVTNSRDTQEVRFPQGIEMMNIFKNYLLKTSILDDFAFYESRQKAMQDKRVRAPMPRTGHLQPKLDDDVVQLASDLQAIDLGGKKLQPVELVIEDAAKA